MIQTRIEQVTEEIRRKQHQREQHALMVKRGLLWCWLKPEPVDLGDTGSIVAKIGELTVSHYGRGYWVIGGRVPLHVARELYADPAGRDLIRAAGHCECPPPDNWADWFMPPPDGREVLPLKEKAQCEGYLARSNSTMLRKVAIDILTTKLFGDDPEAIGAQGFITSYHIDGDLGLRVFVDTLERLGLFKPEPRIVDNTEST